MSTPKFITIDGKSHLWRKIAQLRRERCRATAAADPTQPGVIGRFVRNCTLGHLPSRTTAEPRAFRHQLPFGAVLEQISESQIARKR
jgi:hypothetical protein